jgi:hypothetical protein
MLHDEALAAQTAQVVGAGQPAGVGVGAGEPEAIGEVDDLGTEGADEATAAGRRNVPGMRDGGRRCAGGGPDERARGQEARGSGGRIRMLASRLVGRRAYVPPHHDAGSRAGEPLLGQVESPGS